MAEIRVSGDGGHADTPLGRDETLVARPGHEAGHALPGGTVAGHAAGHALPGGTDMQRPLTGSDHLLATHASPGVPGYVAATDDPDVARAEIEQTRLRMSSTISEIEDALLRKKERIQDRLDVFSPVRERPLPSAGIVFGAGLALGYLTGGDRDGEHRSARAEAYTGSYGAASVTDNAYESYGSEGAPGAYGYQAGASSYGYATGMPLRPRPIDNEWQERAQSAEARIRVLEEVVEQQERELRDVRMRMGTAYPGAEVYDMGGESGSGPSFRENAVLGVTSALTRFFDNMRHRGEAPRY